MCRWEDIPMVQEVVRALREAGARTDSSCGIHVHVGFGEHTPASLRRLVNIFNPRIIIRGVKAIPTGLLMP